MTKPPETFACPLPKSDYDTIQLAHGAGGRLTAQLIETFFLPRFGNPTLNALEDQALVSLPKGKLSFSTDSFVVDPIFFPGGNIGDLAVNGTVNDVAMGGATPVYLSVSFILEEGLPLKTLHRILCSMEAAAQAAGVSIVTGDTKVVNHGQCDQLFITTTGLGVVVEGVHISAGNLQEGDVILLSGSMGDHGMAVLTSREGLSFQTQVVSDTAPLNGLVARMLAVSKELHALRDPTRGGVAATLNELAQASQVGLRIYEERLPVRPEVQGACEILGLDPLYVANEGKLIAVLPEREAPRVLKAMRTHPLGREAVLIGEVTKEHPGQVVMQTTLGTNRIVELPLGEQLPRIC